MSKLPIGAAFIILGEVQTAMAQGRDPAVLATYHAALECFCLRSGVDCGSLSEDVRGEIGLTYAHSLASVIAGDCGDAGTAWRLSDQARWGTKGFEQMIADTVQKTALDDLAGLRETFPGNELCHKARNLVFVSALLHR
jgi:hypothetical protein